VFGLGRATRIYLAAGVTDMRKGFEGLYGLVRDHLACEPLSGHLFLFCNAQRNRLKVLRLLFQRSFFRWRSSVLKLKPRLWQNSLRRIQLLTNSVANC
jgi:transposase